MRKINIKPENVDKWILKKKKEFVDFYLKNSNDQIKTLDKIITISEQQANITKKIAILQFVIFRLDLWFDYFKCKNQIKKYMKEKEKIEQELYVLKNMDFEEKYLLMKSRKRRFSI